MIAITTDFKDVYRLLSHVKGGAPRAVRDTLNDTAKHVRTRASQDIRVKWNVKAGELRKRIKITRATVGRLQALVQADGEPVPVIAFNPRQIRQGVSVVIVKGKRTVIRSGFIQTMPNSGHRGVFVRAGRQRLPIIERKTISPPSMWNQLIDRHVREAGDYLQKRLRSRVQYMLDSGR